MLNDAAISNASVVVANEPGGMAAMTRHLIESGHRRIAYVNGYPHYSESYNGYVNVERLAGYTETLRRYGIEPVSEVIVELNPELYRTGDYSVLEGLLRTDAVPTAIQSAEVASEAVRSLFRLINQPSNARERTVVSTRLVVGTSTAQLSG